MPAPVQDDYTVRLSSFEGPLDLLLHLIRRAEVDIHDIPIASITQSFLAAIGDFEEDEGGQLDIDFAGEFLVMAATLVELKARTLAPKSGEDDGETSETAEEIDPRHELVAQLLAYQRFRSAAGELDDRRRAFADQWAIRLRSSGAEAEPDEPVELELDDVHPGDLARAFERIIAAIDVTSFGDHSIEYDDTPIGLYQDDIVDRLSRREDRRCSLVQILEGHSRGEMIGLFLAMLELARQRLIDISQDDDGGVAIELREALEDEIDQEPIA